MLEHLARESGIETPTAEDLARLDRKRKGKKPCPGEDWVSKSEFPTNSNVLDSTLIDTGLAIAEQGQQTINSG